MCLLSLGLKGQLGAGGGVAFVCYLDKVAV